MLVGIQNVICELLQFTGETAHFVASAPANSTGVRLIDAGGF